MNTVERGVAAERLKGDETFQDVIQSVKDAQVSVFLNPASSQEDREKAHDVIHALSEIEREVDRRINDKAFEEKKDQHRVSD